LRRLFSLSAIFEAQPIFSCLFSIFFLGIFSISSYQNGVLAIIQKTWRCQCGGLFFRSSYSTRYLTYTIDLAGSAPQQTD
jgi:hypothetical protein